MFDRFNFEPLIREFVNTAVALRVVDAVDLVAFVIDQDLNHTPDGSDCSYAVAGWQARLERELVDMVMECAHLQRHAPEGGLKHAALCKLADKIGARDAAVLA